MNKMAWLLSIGTLALSGFAACDDTGPTASGPPPPPPLPALTLSVSADSVNLAPGDSASVIATWVVPAGITSGVTFNMRDVVGGVTATFGNSSGSSSLINLVADSSATDAWRYLLLTVSGQGMTAAQDSLLIRVTVPTP